MTRNKRNKILIFIAALVGMILIYLLVFYAPGKRFNWSEDYKLDKERPYGTWLISELLQHYALRCCRFPFTIDRNLYTDNTYVTYTL